MNLAKAEKKALERQAFGGAAPVRVKREPGPYDDDPTQFMRDAFGQALVAAGGIEPQSAAGCVDRLARHRRMVADRDAKIEKRALRSFGASLPGGAEVRVEARAMSTGLGVGGELSPPGFLLEQYGLAARPTRVLSELCRSQPLPSGISSVTVPRGVTATSETVYAEGTAATDTDITTANCSSQVVSIAGIQDCSQALLDLSPIMPQVLWDDLSKSQAKTLEQQLFFGTGTAAGQLLGLANVAGAVTVAGAGVTTPALFYAALGSAAAQIGNGRYEPATAVLMAIRRWAWLTTSMTTTGQPLQAPHGPGVASPADMAAPGGVGPVASIPSYQSGALLAGLASAADTVFLCRPADDFLLWESSPRLSVTVNAGSGTLTVRVRLYRYTCWLPHRWPAGICQVQNCPQPTGGF